MDILTENRNLNKQNIGNEKQIQKLRVQLNDRLFELHKLEEDHAQEKAQIYIQLQKEKYQHAKTIKELRDKIKDDNENWASKIQEMRAQKEESITKIKQDIRQQMQGNFQVDLKELEERYNKDLSQLQAKMQHQRESHKKRQEEITIKSKTSTQNIIHIHYKQQQEKEKQYKKSLNDLKKEYETNMNKIQALYVNEQLVRKKVENQLQNNIKYHVRERIHWENTQNALNLQISKLNQRIIQLQQTLTQTNIQKNQAQITHKKQIEQINASFSTQIKEINKHHFDVQSQNCQRYCIEIKCLSDQISHLQQIHKRKEQCWQQSGRMVLQLYEKRESKKQDVKAIQKLQVQLIKKDFLIERQRKELQNCKLQLQNMQEVYDRIFIFNSNINRTKNKSYQIKKIKNSCQLNQSNRSTITDKRYPRNE